MKNKSIVYIIGGIVGLGLIIGLAGKGTNFQGYLNFKKVPVNGNIDINKADKSPVKVGLSRSGFNEAKLKNIAESLTDPNTYDSSVTVGASLDQVPTNAGNYGTCTKVTLEKVEGQTPGASNPTLRAKVYFDDGKDYITTIAWERSDQAKLAVMSMTGLFSDPQSHSSSQYFEKFWSYYYSYNDPKIKINYAKAKVTGVEGAHNSVECQKGATITMIK